MDYKALASQGESRGVALLVDATSGQTAGRAPRAEAQELLKPSHLLQPR